LQEVIIPLFGCILILLSIPSLSMLLYMKFKETSVLKQELESFRVSLKEAKKAPTYDAQALLQDLISGHALIKVERLGPLDYFIRSPRG